jgi:hypothetical protein
MLQALEFAEPPLRLSGDAALCDQREAKEDDGRVLKIDQDHL